MTHVEREDDLQSVEDLAIYQHLDGVTGRPIPFKLKDYGDDGALDTTQCDTLRARYGLTEAQVAELSRLVGYALDKDSHINFIKLSRQTVLRRLFDKSLGRRQPDEMLDASSANVLLASLGLETRLRVEDPDEPQGASAGASDGTLQVITQRKARRLLQPDDRSKAIDGRRQAIVQCCCYVALDAGWTLTYTTDFKATRDQRGGRLIELIKNVIGMVSHNAQIGSVHTLKADLHSVWSRFYERVELAVGPFPKKPPERPNAPRFVIQTDRARFGSHRYAKSGGQYFHSEATSHRQLLSSCTSGALTRFGPQ